MSWNNKEEIETVGVFTLVSILKYLND